FAARNRQGTPSTRARRLGGSAMVAEGAAGFAACRRTGVFNGGPAGRGVPRIVMRRSGSESQGVGATFVRLHPCTAAERSADIGAVADRIDGARCCPSVG